MVLDIRGIDESKYVNGTKTVELDSVLFQGKVLIYWSTYYSKWLFQEYTLHNLQTCMELYIASTHSTIMNNYNIVNSMSRFTLS